MVKIKKRCNYCKSYYYEWGEFDREPNVDLAPCDICQEIRLGKNWRDEY